MEAIATIRADNRNTLTTERNQRRRLELDNRRFLDLTSEVTASVEDIANTLKTKSFVSVELLASLKNQLLTEINISVFLNTHGALRGLVREFTGSDTGKQMEAAECLCNLALSEAHSAQIVAKATGAYLHPCLRSLNTQLAVTCAWTLGNLAGSHERVCQILIQQGSLAALTSVLCDTVHEEVREAVCYALVHFVYILKNNLLEPPLTEMVQVLSRIPRDDSAYRLLYLLSCHSQFLSLHTTSKEFISTILEDLSILQMSMTEGNWTTSEKSVHIVRILANVCVVQSSSDFVLQCWKSERYSSQVTAVLTSESDKLRASMLWLLGNIYKSCTKDEGNVMYFKFITDEIL